ncbi:MAG: ArdC family protein, partial [Acetobacterium sp.]|nr:ArdC family protein [Acetobacterium sp.]
MDDKAKQLLKLIEEKVQALAEETDEVRFSETFQSFLAVMGRFHNYSFRNQLLISFGYTNATHVAGYKDWARKFNRQVKKGEHGIAILAPVFWNKTESKNTPDADQNEKEGVIITTDEDGYLRFGKDFVSFRTVYVFDVSQTEGDPLPEAPNWHD